VNFFTARLAVQTFAACFWDIGVNLTCFGWHIPFFPNLICDNRSWPPPR